MSTREGIVSTLGPNLTKVFGLDQLPEELYSFWPYATYSQLGNQIITMVGDKLLSISDRELTRSSACFAIQANEYDNQGYFAHYALYTRRGNHRKNPDFVHHAQEFMINSTHYLSQVLALPIIGAIADWKADEVEFQRFSDAYETCEHVPTAVRSTWAGPIIMDHLGYQYAVASPHSLHHLKQISSLDVYFTESEFAPPDY